MKAKVFLDTAYAIALSASTDDFHRQAVQLADILEKMGTCLVTTQAVLLEIGNALSKVRYRKASIRLLNALVADPTVKIIPLSSELYTRAFLLYSERPDKEWGLVDCISFIVMWDLEITEVLTTDEHFRQAGFRPLLLD